MTTNTITSNVYHGVSLTVPGNYSFPIVAVASGVTVSGSAYGIRTGNGGWTIENYGTISASLGNSEGIDLTFRGSVINETDGSIGGGEFGVKLEDGGSVTNQGGGTIAGGIFSDLNSLPVTVDNSGYISAGIGLDSGGSVTNGTTGTINGGVDVASAIEPSIATVINDGTITGGVTVNGHVAGTVENAGTITGSEFSVYLHGVYTNLLIIDPGAVFNGSVYAFSLATNTMELTSGAAAGTIYRIGQYQGFQTVTIDSGATWSLGEIYAPVAVENSGTINGRGSGLDLAGGGSVTNAATGKISGGINGVYIHISSGSGFIYNLGAITGTDGSGVKLDDGGSVTNASGVSISGGLDGVYIGGTGTVDNAGAITGTGGYGVNLTGGGSVTNAAGGTISGGNYGVRIQVSLGTVDNAGAITGTNVKGVYLEGGGSLTNASGGSISSYRSGVYIGGTGTVDNLGAITGTIGDGVGLFSGGSVTNAVTGKISGNVFGVFGGGSSLTVENAGTITGGTDSVYLDATDANRLIVDAGAVFNGDVVAYAGAVNTIELTSSAAAGTLSGLGSQFQNFQTVTIDSGARWMVGGTISGTIDGTDMGAGASLTVAANSTIEGTKYGVDLTNGGSVTNAAGATITSTDSVYSLSDYVYVNGRALYSDKGGAAVTIDNAGNVLGGIQGVFLGNGGAVINEATGSIGASVEFFRADGIDLFNGGSVTNAAGGTITGYLAIYSYRFGASATVDNSGSVNGRSAGVYLDAGGSVTNESTGSIGAEGSGVGFLNGGSVTNENGGTITAGFYGVRSGSGVPTTVDNAGNIYGGETGIGLTAGFVTNAATGTIAGGQVGINVYGDAVSIINDGEIIGDGSYGIKSSKP
jgi:hypothetical protein